MNTDASRSFAWQWQRAVLGRANQTFLVWEGPGGQVSTWTYAEFDALVDRVAGGLQDRGVSAGGRVSIVLRNSPCFVAVWLALVKLGGVLVPSDPSATTPELVGHLRRSEACLGICAPDRSRTFRAAADVCGVPVVEMSEADTTLEDLGRRPASYAEERPAPGDLAALMFTSGTTSVPKCVMVTQRNYGFAGEVMAAAAGLRPGDRQLVVLPMFHANAQYYSFAAAIAVGASVALMHTFSASGFLRQAVRHQATHASLFAAPIRMILAKRAGPVAGLRLVHCWYAQNITDEQYTAFAQLLGCRPRQLYGMTETLPAVLTNGFAAPVPQAMGQVTLGCEVDVRDPACDQPVVPGAVGDLLVRGIPGATLFAGYLGEPEATAASYRNGWFVTGDRATVDAAGNVYFAGRRSDILKIAGENVSVVEIEAVVAEHPAVLEVAVVGKPDPVLDEVPVAFVVAYPGLAPDALDGLPAWCAGRLSKPKRPVRFEHVPELPRTSVGKIRKFMLSEGTPT